MHIYSYYKHNCSVTNACLTHAAPWTSARQVSLSFAISLSLFKLLSIESCHPTISSFVVSFSSCSQSLPASGSFPMSQIFTSDDQSIGDSASVLSMNIQGWFPLGLTSLTPLLSKGLSRVSRNLHSFWSYVFALPKQHVGHLPTWGLLSQCHIFLPFHTVHGVLEARILKWFAIPFSNYTQYVKLISSSHFIL